MIPIVRIPQSLKRRLFDDAGLRALFSTPQWKHFQEIVLALIVAFSRRTIKTQARHLVGTPRTTLGDFYTRSPVDTQEVLRYLCVRALREAGVQKGDGVDLILDDSHARKRGKKIQGAGKYFDAAMRTYLYGHNFIAAVVRVGNLVVPFDIRRVYKKVWARKLNLPFRTLNDLAVLLIDAFAEVAKELGINVRVLFDAFYMNKKVVHAINRHGLIWVSVLASNRAVKIHGRKTHVGEYRRCIPRKAYRKVLCRTSEGEKAYWAVSRKAYLPKIGEVKIVFSRRSRDERALPIVSNAYDVSMQTIIEWYRRRWAIEVHFFKAAKQLLGLAEYQTGIAEGIQKHLRLVACVCALLAMETLRWEGQAKTTGGRKRPGVGLREARDRIRREVFGDFLEHLENSHDPKDVLRQLREFFRDVA
jgi:hypothetical protein